MLALAGPEIRFEPLWTSSQVASWVGDGDGFERWARQALDAAREAQRKDLEVVAVQGLASAYLLRLEIDEAVPLIERAFELAEASGSIVGQAGALNCRGWLDLARDRPVEAEASFTAARDLYAEIGNPTREATMEIFIGRCAALQGDDERAEGALRGAVRTLKGLRDRSQLCEAQRSLAEVLARTGRVDEAERVALEAIETVGPDDRVSISTTRFALGLVRAAQRRDDEAESLLREAADELGRVGLRAGEREALRTLVAFLRERGRDADATPYEERLARLAPESTAQIA